MQICSMAEICQSLSNNCLYVVDSVYANPCSHREPTVLPGLFEELIQIALREEKTRFNQCQQFQGFSPPSDNILKKWFKLPFPWSHKVSILFRLNFTRESRDFMLMEWQKS